MDIHSFLGLLLVLIPATIVFIVLPVGLALPNQQEREYKAWRKANGYDVCPGNIIR